LGHHNGQNQPEPNPVYCRDRVEAARRLANLDKVRKSEGMKHGGDVKKYAKGGSVSSASRRADGIAKKGKTRCKMV